VEIILVWADILTTLIVLVSYLASGELRSGLNAAIWRINSLRFTLLPRLEGYGEMAYFDPESERRHLQAVYGVPRLLAKDFVKCQAAGALGSNARALLDGALRCILVGYDGSVGELLKTCEEFLLGAIDIQELSADAISLGSAYGDLAICRWLCAAVQDQISFDEMADLYDRGLSTGQRVEWTDLDLILHEYLAAGHAAKAIATFERAGVKEPASPRRAKRAGAAAYVLAQQMLDGRYDAGDVEAMLNSLFESHVSTKWLGKGHYRTAAVWMKVAFWSPGERAIETVLRCYDFLPQDAPAPIW
jgi:hypothetical protein